MQAAPKEDSNTAKKKAAYEDAFSHVCGYIEDRIPGREDNNAARTVLLLHAGETSELFLQSRIHNTKTEVHVKRFSRSTYNMQLLGVFVMLFCSFLFPPTKLNEN